MSSSSFACGESYGYGLPIKSPPPSIFTSRFDGGSPSFSPVKKTGGRLVRGFSRDLGLNLAENGLKRDFQLNLDDFATC